MARRWSTPFEIIKPGSISEEEQKALKDVWRAYTTATLRGFLAYLLFIAGYLVVVPENSLSQLTPGQYGRLAGATSSLAFLVGFEPRTLSRLIKMVFLGDKDGQGGAEQPAKGQGPSEASLAGEKPHPKS